jgi:glycosyltransferase involved in cell wall biosynthesis
MDSNYKTISLIVANYNNAPYLKAFIHSVLHSTRLPDEWIIIDDGSTDDSRAILERYAGVPFLNCIFLPKNQGFTSALNLALQSASGDYIARADPDDILHQDRLQVQYDFMRSNPEIDVLGSNADYFLTDWTNAINKTNFPKNHTDILQMFRKGENALLHATAFVKGNIYKKYRYQPQFPGEDYELFARMIRDGYQFYNLKDVWYHVRVHQKSSTSILKFSHIERTFEFRDKIFGTHSSIFLKWRYYIHLYAYRRYQLQHGSILRLFWLMVTGFTYPKKVFMRILKIIERP